MTATALYDEDAVTVDKRMLYRTLDYVLEKAVQNHLQHINWNEGAGEFGACGREDCKAAREILGQWSIHRGIS